MVKIGIVGLGAVGTAVLQGMREHHSVSGYDIDGRGKWVSLLRTGAVFVCVPTDALPNGELNMKIVEEVVSRLANDEYKGLIIVKSTLHPGVMDKMHASHPNCKLVYMPEFLREKDAVEWFQEPDRLVASGNHYLVSEAFELFTWVPEDIPRMKMSFLEAEIGKLAHNAYIATKVTFTCEVERICNSIGANSANVMEVVWRDRRVGNSAHLTPGLGGFSGKCVPKDTSALATIDKDQSSLLHQLIERGSHDEILRRVTRLHDWKETELFVEEIESDGC